MRSGGKAPSEAPARQQRLLTADPERFQIPHQQRRFHPPGGTTPPGIALYAVLLYIA